MSDQQETQPTPKPFPTEDARARRVIAMAGCSPVVLCGMDETYRDRLAALIDEQGQVVEVELPDEEGNPRVVPFREHVRLVLLDYHASRKATSDETDKLERTPSDDGSTNATPDVARETPPPASGDGPDLEDATPPATVQPGPAADPPAASGEDRSTN